MFLDIINSLRSSEKWRKQVLNGMYSLCCILYGTPFCYLRGEGRRTYICTGVYTHKEHWKDTKGIKNGSYPGWTFGEGWIGSWDGQQRWKGEFSLHIFIITITTILFIIVGTTNSSICWVKCFQQCNKILSVICLGLFSTCLWIPCRIV